MNCSFFSAEAAEATVRKSFEYGPASDEADVLHEQLEYLIRHSQDCPAECQECRRLASVKQLLMSLWS
jgi:hypothetical protein